MIREFLLGSLFFVCFVAQAKEPVKFSKKKIKINQTIIEVEIADTDAKRALGLMNRKKLDKNSGMLFVFSKEKTLSFWMKNTYIPLSIGFFNRKLRLVNIENMEPQKSVMDLRTKSYQSSKFSMYALEVNRGWFEKHKIKKGAKLFLEIAK